LPPLLIYFSCCRGVLPHGFRSKKNCVVCDSILGLLRTCPTLRLDGFVSSLVFVVLGTTIRNSPIIIRRQTHKIVQHSQKKVYHNFRIQDDNTDATCHMQVVQNICLFIFSNEMGQHEDLIFIFWNFLLPWFVWLWYHWYHSRLIFLLANWLNSYIHSLPEISMKSILNQKKDGLTK
jgi:hypothetical protein